MNYAGLIYDHSVHYLDHLGPFCALMGWPLIVCEEEIGDLARKYYPDLQVVQKSFWEVEIPRYTVTCDTYPLIQAAFPHQDTQTIWLPHGNSDKGWESPFFEALQQEKIALIYGQKMLDFLRAKGVFLRTVQIGNFRWIYYQKHRSFYQKLFHPLLPSQKCLLYAPTWDDAENNNSFWRSFPSLARSFPSHLHLLVKLHPNTLRRFPVELEILQGRLRGQPNLSFLPEFPPIYPLLAHMEAYIGDMSSIGYDFLTFDKPLFFLNQKPSLYLSQCGLSIEPENFSFPQEDTLSSRRKTAYAYTFQEEPNWPEKIYALCRV